MAATNEGPAVGSGTGEQEIGWHHLGPQYPRPAFLTSSAAGLRAQRLLPGRSPCSARRVQKLIDELSKLPGIGPKTAQRLASSAEAHPGNKPCPWRRP